MLCFAFGTSGKGTKARNTGKIYFDTGALAHIKKKIEQD